MKAEHTSGECGVVERHGQSSLRGRVAQALSVADQIRARHQKVPLAMSEDLHTLGDGHRNCDPTERTSTPRPAETFPPKTSGEGLGARPRSIC